MRRVFLIVPLCLAAAGLAGAQMTKPSANALGAHLNYGRGCSACHSPHSSTSATGSEPSVSSSSGTIPLWGENLSNMYRMTISTGGGKFVDVLPASLSANTPDVAGMMTCLGCHDGNYAPKAMMKNRIFESLPASYGVTNTIPTLLGDSEGGSGYYLNNHPVGLSARISCGGENWDCAEVNGVISMSGANSSQFVTNYGFFVKPGNYNKTSVVVCTTCHDPHSMNVVTVSNSTSGLPAGTYTTMFFLRAPYSPNDMNRSSNQTAQFCRQCHGDKSNEMNGSTARTVF
jgi:cytochrome c553